MAESDQTAGHGHHQPEVAKNVIFLLPDGFGPAQAAAYRGFIGVDPVWEEGLKALVQTASADNPVADSAASANAYATGVSTYNGGVGVDTGGNPVVSVLDLASDAGKATGIVSTATISDASPAAFAASNVDRDNQDQIAQEYIDNGDLDVILGGGHAAFTMDPDGDGATTLEEAQAAGFQYITTAEGLKSAPDGKLLGLFAEKAMSAPIGTGEPGAPLPPEPTLAEMTEVALDHLAGDEDGFFLFVEEEGTDTWGHASDAPAVMHSAKAFEDASLVALEFAQEHPDTLVVSVADHETGGMTLDYKQGTPGIFQNFQATYKAMFTDVQAAVADLGKGADATAVAGAVTGVVSELTTLTLDEIASVLGAATPQDAYSNFPAALNARGGVKYTTDGHTAMDVPLYAYGPGADQINGVVDNTSVGQWLAKAMGVELPAKQQDNGEDLVADVEHGCHHHVPDDTGLLV